MLDNLDTSRRCITGAPTTEDRCVGFCKNRSHLGYVTQPILERRECIEKRCHYFVPIKEHPFWNRREKMLQKESERKEELKNIRKYEKTIPNDLRIPPESVLLCKHLYENVYILVCKKGLKLEPCYKLKDLVIYAFDVEKRKEQNIGITYSLLLPPEMREKKIKNDQIKRER